MPAKVRDVDRMLQGKLGAGAEERRGHTWYMIFYQDRLLAQTALSRSYAEISDDLLARIARELKINLKQLRLLLACPWRYDDYVAQVTGVREPES
jgi:hypothetical protein